MKFCDTTIPLRARTGCVRGGERGVGRGQASATSATASGERSIAAAHGGSSDRWTTACAPSRR